MRLDLYLLSNNFVVTRSQATDLIKRGFVYVDGQKITKPGFQITSQIIKIEEKKFFVSRGGEKLYQVLIDFNIDLQDKVAIDIGASTGGFSDCLLSMGVKTIYAYDVGKDQLHEKLKKDSRVISYEQTNILNVNLPDADFIVIDVSFTSIKPIFEHIKNHAADVLALIKPQFEIGKTKLKQGVVKDKKAIMQILNDIENFVLKLDYDITNLKPSVILGKEGNQEYFIYLKKKIFPREDSYA
jgi:23S rRNA (cytidine1920-2'-O)/16S rRNA (cytidine1409-2'-O)-methyltransferase